jgi:hypothetical protein
MRADRGEEHDLLANGQASPEIASEAERLRGLLRAARRRAVAPVTP